MKLLKLLFPFSPEVFSFSECSQTNDFSNVTKIWQDDISEDITLFKIINLLLSSLKKRKDFQSNPLHFNMPIIIEKNFSPLKMSTQQKIEEWCSHRSFLKVVGPIVCEKLSLLEFLSYIIEMGNKFNIFLCMKWIIFDSIW